MKKIFTLLYLIPVFAFAQTNLVKWFSADLAPTLVEKNVSSGPVTGVKSVNYGIEDQFYSTDGNFSTSATPDLSKFIQFKISANSGYRIQLSDFSFWARKQGGKPKFQIRFSKNAGFSNPALLLGETLTSGSYVNYHPDFPANTFVESGETMYVRIYVYATNDNFHISYNQTGSIAPLFSGKVSLTTPVKPLAVDDQTATLKNTPVEIDVLANDDYRYSGLLSAINTIKPAHGNVVTNGVNSISYTPDANYAGYDSFYYTLTNAAGVSNTAKVEIQVIGGTENVLVRWNKTDKSAKNYTVNVAGSDLKAVGETLTINDNEGMSSGAKAFMLSDLPNTQEFNGKLDPFKFLSFSVANQNAESIAYLKSLKFSYRSRGTGNMTIRYSKNPEFTENVYTVADDISYGSTWNIKEFSLSAGLYLFPGETVYFRIYNYNSYNVTLIDFIPNGEVGPAITGFTALYTPEPCSNSVSWNGVKWSGTPDITKKAILNATYSTAANGAFEACKLMVNVGKLTIDENYPVKIQGEITVNPAATVELKSGANFVQTNDTAPANEGIMTVLQEIKIGEARNQYNYIGSPVVFSAGESFRTIYPGISSVLSYNEYNNFFSNFSGVAPAGKGLALQEPTVAGVPLGAAAVTAQFTGTPQNGIYQYALGNSNTAANSDLGYNLVANPYPSNIDIAELYKANTNNGQNPNISSTIYFWDNNVNNDVAQTQQGTSYSGQAYAVFNALAGKNGTGTSAAGYLNNNVTGNKRPTNILTVAQGFLVRSMAKNYILKFSNSMRTTASPEAKFLGKAEDPEEEDRFWIKMIAPSNLTSNAAVIYFEQGNAVVGEEDSESGGASDEIFTIVGDKKLSINGKPSFDISDQIALGTTHFGSGNYTITVAEKEGIFSAGQHIYIKDRQTGIISDITNGSYTFEAAAGQTSSRFEILFKPASVLATADSKKSDPEVYRSGEDFVVQSQTKKINTVEVYDPSGRLIYKTKPNRNTLIIPANRIMSGVSILKIAQGGTVTTKKIIK